MAEQENSAYQQYYSEDSFWNKVREQALAAGLVVVEKALCLYYAARDPATPAWAKGTVVGALGYFIFPLDAIPDAIPVVGYADDFGVLTLAAATIAAYIRPDHTEKARQTLKQWFGDEATTER